MPNRQAQGGSGARLQASQPAVYFY